LVRGLAHLGHPCPMMLPDRPHHFGTLRALGKERPSPSVCCSREIFVLAGLQSFPLAGWQGDVGGHNVDGAEADGYAELPDQIAQVVIKLQASAEGELADDIQRLLSLVQDFHRIGLTRFVEMVQQWRGEIFLDAVNRDPVLGVLLKAYELPGTE